MNEQKTPEIDSTEIKGFPVFLPKKYLEISMAKKINGLVEACLNCGKNHILIDFSQCPTIISPGVVGVLELMYKVVDDYGGVLVISGLSDFHARVFTMAHIFPEARRAATLEEGIEILENPGK